MAFDEREGGNDGDLALVLDFDSRYDTLSIDSYSYLPVLDSAFDENTRLANLYLYACYNLLISLPSDTSFIYTARGTVAYSGKSKSKPDLQYDSSSMNNEAESVKI